MDNFKELISKHLGRAGDGSVVKPYVTPDKHDKSLLVPIPRSYNREKSNITAPFVGYEAWHAYEMSFLKQNGMPVTGVLKIVYGKDVPFMVESKSLKLYLNSFDLEKFDSISQVQGIIETDLSEALDGYIGVCLHDACEINSRNLFTLDMDRFTNVDQMDFNIDEYRENPDLLVASTTGLTTQSFHTANLRSNCEITNQKDTGNSYIFIKGKQVPTLESLTKYIFSLRDSQHFHENVTEIVYDTLYNKYQPEQLIVINLYNRRGGIDIHSIRADSWETIDEFMEEYDRPDVLFEKTAQS